MKHLFLALMAMTIVASGLAQPNRLNPVSPFNGTPNSGLNPGHWTFGLGSGASFALNNNEKSLFRGNSIATKIIGNYNLGSIGLGFTGGWLPGTISQTGVNQFMAERKIQQGQAQVATSNPFNSYFLFGPGFHLGDRVSVSGQVQGGFFLNNPGAVSIVPNGATRPAYRFDGGTKNIAPGFSGALQLGYPINSSTRFLINTDYLFSSSTIRLLDPGAGIDIATEQKRKLQVFTAGIGIVKIFRSRDVASGQATGRRSREIKSPRDIATGQATGKRILPASNTAEVRSPRDIATGQATGRRSSIAIDESGVHRTNGCCGPVTDRTVYEDGTMEEITFSCPEDAAIYFHEIKSPRDIASGQATGKRSNITIDESGVHRTYSGCGPVTDRVSYPDGWVEERTFSCAADAATYFHEVKSPRDIASGQATGRRSNITIDESGVHRTIESCGPVTQRFTSPDGQTSEQRFSCPNDAITYASINGNNSMPNRISMNMTTARQTQGATFGEKVNAGLQAAGSSIAQRQTQGSTFGEKVNAGLHAAGSALSQGASLTVISGNLSWTGSSSTGIVTNNAVSSVSGIAGGSGSGAAAASYAATGRMAENGSNNPKGMLATIYIRESGTGAASGKNGRDIASGQATGKRQYEPVFNEGNGDGISCTGCVASVKSNPLYTGTNSNGNNPLNQKSKEALSYISVLLLDAYSYSVLAQTSPLPNGDFWFANVPEGNYIVKVSGSITVKKQYDITLNGKSPSDVAGQMQTAPDTWILKVNSGNNANASRMINTSRSNIKQVVVIDADTDGDGSPDHFNVIGTFSDGSSADITSKCTINTSRSNIKQITIPFDATVTPGTSKTINTSRSNIKHISISVGDINGNGSTSFSATSTLNDGSSKDISSLTKLSPHPNVIQFQIDTDDSDGDGAADLIWSPRSNVNESSSRKGWDGTVKGLSSITADTDGDGVPERVIGNSLSYQKRATLLGGALPGGAVISALVAGNPIGGLNIKGGKNPGGNQRTTTTNEEGEFEFTGWEAGTYSIETEQKIVIEDETFIVATVADDQDASARKGWDGTVKGGKQTPNTSFGEKGVAGSDTNDTDTPATRAQNNNTVRSNRTDQCLIEADLDGDGSFETRILNFNSEVAGFSIGEKGMPKDLKKSGSGLKDVVRTQVRMASGGNNGNAVPVKWMAPEVIGRLPEVHGDPHVDTKDGKMLLGDNNEWIINKENWKSTAVSVKTVQSPGDVCYIITSQPQDFPDKVTGSLSSIKASPVANMEVLFTNEKGSVYKLTTDAQGIIRLNSLPPNTNYRMFLNLTASGSDDFLILFSTDASGSAISNVLKTKHDTAKNSVSNIR